jgi:hypothetical protein
MRTTLSPVKVIAASGIPAGEAIRAALSATGTIQDFADRHGLPRSAVSGCIHGHQRHERIRAALAIELGVDRPWLDGLLDGTQNAA